MNFFQEENFVDEIYLRTMRSVLLGFFSWAEKQIDKAGIHFRGYC